MQLDFKKDCKMKNMLLLSTLFSFSLYSKIIINGQEKTVVYVDMVADLFHEGHVNMLKRAKHDICPDCHLLVGLMSDADTASYKRLPILTLKERTAVVEACKYVDKVIPGSPLSLTQEFIEQHGIDIVLHGDDMSEETLALYYRVPMQMGILRTIAYTAGISTSDIIRRIVARADEFKK